LNYRHAFHAGNFADLVKHAGLLALIARRGAGPLSVIDTHAGAGLYDLSGEAAQRSGEALAGVGRLMAEAATPASLERLKAAVRRANPKGGARFYPGSPWLAAEALHPRDSYLGCELAPQEHASLVRAMQGRAHVSVLRADGFTEAPRRCPPAGEALVLIDPPFERPDDYRRIVETAAAVARRNPAARLLIWAPLKDLETFDALLRDLQAVLGPGLLAAEARMRPLDDPMRMNGCALLIARAPAGLEEDLEAICSWTVRTLGDNGRARVWRLD